MGDTPIAGDWNGDGKDTPGLRRGTTWYLRNGLAAGAVDKTFDYGASGDRPVSGGWDADPADEIGVARKMTWYLRDDASSGPSTQTFRM